MPPIELLYAKSRILRRPDTVEQELMVASLVRNLAYRKSVEVVWAGEDGAWRNLDAEYVGPSGESSEIWHARTTIPLTPESSLPGDIQFLLHYHVAGQDYWAPAGQQSYAIGADSGIRLADRLPLLHVDFAPNLHVGQQFYPITIAVRQDLHPEKVAIRWTTDHWDTVTDTPAFLRHKHWHRAVGSHARNPNRYGCGQWISQLHLGHAYRVEYALCCLAKGRRYWDNNSGLNYLARHDRLKVMTLNLHCYQEDRQEEKFAQIAKAIRDLHIDVVCLQEVGEHWNDGTRELNSNAARIIRDQLGEHYSMHADWSHFGFGRYREGSAILSRYPILEAESKYVSASQDVHDIHARRVVMAQIDVPYFGVINVFSVHLSWWESGFQVQFENLRRWAESRETPDLAATLLCGDFNNAANTKGYELLSKEYEDQFFRANAQYLSQIDDRRIDYLLMKKGGALNVKSAYRLFTSSDYGRVSDHEGYCAEFEPPE
ncbi:MAG: endonuclease/exonuclease/phosphatase family protein [Pirellulaceae bacterium]|nr:endonuclease/exonuclease/phosphatase family protein [Pirellulaceae bacterium]